MINSISTRKDSRGSGAGFLKPVKSTSIGKSVLIGVGIGSTIGSIKRNNDIKTNFDGQSFVIHKSFKQYKTKFNGTAI